MNGILLALVCGSCASTQPLTPSLATPPPLPALAGPGVNATADARPTLIRRDFEGRIVRPDHPIEEDAVRALNLDEPTRLREDQVLARRARLFDEALIANLDLLVEAESTFTAGSPADKASFLQRAMHALGPVNSGGSLEAQIRAALPADQRRALSALLREYWDAVVADARAGVSATDDRTMMAGDMGPPVPAPKGESAFAIVLRERGPMLAGEIRRSFDRLLKSGGVVFAYLTRGMTLSPEQREKAMAACEEFARRTNNEGTPAENLRFAATLVPIFDDDQRVQLLANARGVQRPGSGSAVATPPKATNPGKGTGAGNVGKNS
jgi:hypothetical protein